MRLFTVFGLLLLTTLALNPFWQEGKAQYEPQSPNPTEQAKPPDRTLSKKAIPNKIRRNQPKKKLDDDSPETDSRNTFKDFLMLTSIIAGLIGTLGWSSRDDEYQKFAAKTLATLSAFLAIIAISL